MKRVTIIILLFFVVLAHGYAQRDIIIMRNGMSFTGKVILVSNDKTIFKSKDNGQQELSNLDIYMIKYDKRGNVFFTEKGDRITDNENDNKVPKGATLVYLTDSREIAAEHLAILVDSIILTPIKKKEKFSIPFVRSKSNDTRIVLAKKRVFLIWHPDGTKDVITDFETLKKMKLQEIEKKRAQERKSREEAWLRSFPKSATIITKKNVIIPVLVLTDGETEITYKKEKLDNSPIFTMDKANIQDLFYKDKRSLKF